MIDLHSHILPGLDDGPESLEKALKMAEAAVQDGISVVVATPHCNNGVYRLSPERILYEVNRLKESLEESRIPLKVLPGADVHISVDLLEDVKAGNIMTVNNNQRYLMLELPELGVPAHLPDFVWELKLNGFTPIFTHPERNAAIQDDINVLHDLITHGALCQVTAMSLTGGFGKRARKCALSLLKHSLVHVIATDAHSVRRRPPLLSPALRVAGEIVGDDYALRMVTEIPERIITGAPVSHPEPRIRKSWFFERLLSRG